MSHLCQFWFSKCDIKLDNRMIFAMSFPGARWYVVTVWVPQMVRDEKKFGKVLLFEVGHNT